MHETPPDFLRHSGKRCRLSFDEHGFCVNDLNGVAQEVERPISFPKFATIGLKPTYAEEANTRTLTAPDPFK